MSRTASIPRSLHRPILYRWRAGSSPTAIVRWIEETNVGREVPVHTSRSSVQRLVQALAETDGHRARIHSILRARVNASAALDELEDIQGQFRALYERASEPGVDPKAVNLQAHVLGRWHASIHRDLKLAGITGAAAEQLMMANEDYVFETMEATIKDDKAMPREIPEVGDIGRMFGAPPVAPPVQQQPSAPVQPAPAAASDAAMPSPAQTSGAAGVPESNDLKLKQIIESIRAAMPRPEAADVPQAPTQDGAAFRRERIH